MFKRKKNSEPYQIWNYLQFREKSTKIFILGRPFNRLIIRRRDFVCMRRPSLTVIKYRDRAGF